MTHITRKHLIRIVAPFALAIVITFSGPVFHLARTVATPVPPSTHVTVIYKQKQAPAVQVEVAPGKSAMAG